MNVMGQTGRCPVTILSGFLGTGKTTILRRMLRDLRPTGVAVVLNEFGAVGLDHELVRLVVDQSTLVSGGCLCCTRRDDLVRVLKELWNLNDKRTIPKLSRVLIETSGLADPVPIHFTLVTDPVLQHHFFVDSVIVTVDAVNGTLHLSSHLESRKQIMVADWILITKVDMASPQRVEELLVQVRSLNPAARVILGLSGDLPAELFTAPERELRSWLTDGRDESLQKVGESTHSDVSSLSLRFDRPIDWVAFGVWLSMLLHARGEDVLRVKGLLNVGHGGPILLNGVQHVIHAPEHLEHWPSTDERSRLVFVVKNVDVGMILRSLRSFQGTAGKAELQLDFGDFEGGGSTSN